MEYYEFYNALDRTKKYPNYNELINVGNQLVSKLDESFASTALSKCNILIKNDLISAYINSYLVRYMMIMIIHMLVIPILI